MSYKPTLMSALFTVALSQSATAGIHGSGISSEEGKLLCSYIPACVANAQAEKEYYANYAKNLAKRVPLPQEKRQPIPEVKVLNERLQNLNVLGKK